MNCTSCKDPNLTEVDFYFVKKTQRYQTQCKKCIAEYRKANKDKINVSRRKYYSKNKDSLSEYARKYYEDNLEYRKKRQVDFAKYYSSHKNDVVRGSAKTFNSQAQTLDPIEIGTFDIDEYAQLPGLSKVGK